MSGIFFQTFWAFSENLNLESPLYQYVSIADNIYTIEKKMQNNKYKKYQQQLKDAKNVMKLLCLTNLQDFWSLVKEVYLHFC